MERQQRVFRAIAPALCALLAACSSLPRLPPGHELAIRPATDSQPDISVVLPASSVPAIAGGALGAGAGVAASAGCGLLIIVCLPLFALGGGAAGGAAGAMAGAPESSKRATAEDMRKRLTAIARDAEPARQLTTMLNDRAKAHWSLVPSSATHTLSVHVTEISLHPSGAEQMSLTVRAVAMLTSAGSVVPQSSTFVHTGPTAPAAQWMEESGDFLKSAIARGCEDLAQQVFALLSSP